MGEVYRARDTRLGREVALKVISDGAALDPERLQRFEHEARAAGCLNHPNLVVVHDVGAPNGGALPGHRAARGRAAAIAADARPRCRRPRCSRRQIAEGLAAAHDSGASSTATSSRRTCSSPRTVGVKILDFGLAKLPRARRARERRADCRRLHPEHRRQGRRRLGYRSPEQLRGRPPTTAPTSSASAHALRDAAALRRASTSSFRSSSSASSTSARSARRRSRSTGRSVASPRNPALSTSHLDPESAESLEPTAGEHPQSPAKEPILDVAMRSRICPPFRGSRARAGPRDVRREATRVTDISARRSRRDGPAFRRAFGARLCEGGDELPDRAATGRNVPAHDRDEDLRDRSRRRPPLASPGGSIIAPAAPARAAPSSASCGFRDRVPGCARKIAA